VEIPNGSDREYTHILQKVGLLKNFSVAKIISKKEIDDLKQLIRAVAKDETEYNKMLSDEMKVIANMHDDKNPVPGIIYFCDSKKSMDALKLMARKYVIELKAKKIAKRELCFLIAIIIKELGLTQRDFLDLNEGEDESDPPEIA
jgi:hypothetical protein